MHRKVALKDHKLVYWLAGGLSALSVLLEKKARRGELALYVLPRAGESLWYILVNRRLLPDIKNAEVILMFLTWSMTYTVAPSLSLTLIFLHYILPSTRCCTAELLLEIYSAFRVFREIMTCHIICANLSYRTNFS